MRAAHGSCLAAPQRGGAFARSEFTGLAAPLTVLLIVLAILLPIFDLNQLVK